MDTLAGDWGPILSYTFFVSHESKSTELEKPPPGPPPQSKPQPEQQPTTNHNKNKKSKKKKPATPVLFWFKVLQFVLVILMYFLDCLSFLLPILQSLAGLAAFAKLGLGCLQEAWGLTPWWSHWSASVGSIGLDIVGMHHLYPFVWLLYVYYINKL